MLVLNQMKKYIIVTIIAIFCFINVTSAQNKNSVPTNTLIENSYVTHSERLKDLSVNAYYIDQQNNKIKAQEEYIKLVHKQLNTVYKILTGILLFILIELLTVLIVIKKLR